MAKKKIATGKISNRRAKFDYELGDSFVVGLQLTGAETKALRQNHGNLTGAYVTVNNNELWLINALISGSNSAPISETDQTRTRKLLVKRSELDKLIDAKAGANTIVPLEILTKGRYVKLRIAIGRGKKIHDKRETIKKRQQEREAHQAESI